MSNIYVNDIKEICEFRASPTCTVKIEFEGWASQEAVNQLQCVLEIVRNTFPTQEEINAYLEAKNKRSLSDENIKLSEVEM